MHIFLYILIDIIFLFFLKVDGDKIKDLQEKLKEAKSKGDEVRRNSREREILAFLKWIYDRVI